MLLSCMLMCVPTAYAATKKGESRAIGIVFDNSGSMYSGSNQAWCRATYAMEVFASMLNAGDVLQIYPMWPIDVGGKTYTMDEPFQITDSAQASLIRDIYTPEAWGTPIESIDSAANGLQSVQADKKYMIILTDGSTFSKGGIDLYYGTQGELDSRVNKYAGPNMTVMYLGIGAGSTMPSVAESEYFVKKQAVNSQDVLSSLTVMCNQIFGRDTLPKNRISGNSIEFDISMSKLIVFVQGENISNLKLSGSSVGQMISSQQTMYSTKGSAFYQPNNPDTTLQGMMVTYTDCGSGTYNIEYSGTATSIEVYYEPDADLDFVFTDSEGNTVNPNALYEGDYKVSFGMKDAKTGKLISSDLLGNPKYKGSYSINGQEHTFTHEGFNGSVEIPLKMGEKFEANLTVTYLSGYTIFKNSVDFGWPEGGIQVSARPAGDFRIEISGGDSNYSLQELEEGSPYIVKVYYKGVQLTGSELEKVDLEWNSDTSNADIQKEFSQDHWKLTLHYKDPTAPQNTVCGDCTVSVYARYTAQGSSEAQAQGSLTYTINDNFSPVQVELIVPNDYIVIKELEESKAITAKLTIDGRPLTPEEFASVSLQVDCGGVEHTVTPCEQDSSYLIKLLPTDGIDEGRYPIKVTANFTDQFGRTTQTDGSTAVTLSKLPLWVKCLIWIGLIIALILLILAIMHIRKFPSRLRPDTDGCSLRVGGRDVTEDANFFAKLSGKQIVVYVEYNADELGRVSLNKLSPGKDSYLYKPSHKRSFGVKFPESVSVSGEVNTVDIAGIEYNVSKDGVVAPAEEQQAPYTITNGSSVTMNGKTLIAGKPKNFSAEIPLNFKKR